MRFSIVALCTLTAIAPWNSVRVAHASMEGDAGASVSNLTPSKTLVAQVSPAAPENTPQTAPQTANVQYYQDYQPITNLSAPSTQAQATPNPTLNAPDSPAGIGTGGASDYLPATYPTGTGQSNSGSSSGTNRPTVQVPAVTPSKPVTAPPARSSDLFVTATDVQVVGADPELQQLVLNTAQTKPGGGTSPSQLQRDVAAILATGFFANASVTSRPNATGVSVVFQVDPVVVRSLQLSGAKVLTYRVVNEFFSNQLGAAIRPSALSQSVKQVNDWYKQNGYILGRVLTLKPSRNGILTLEVAEGLIGDVRFRFLNDQGQTVDERGRPIQNRTRESFLRKQIQLKPGQVFSEPVARKDLQQLAQLGIFGLTNIKFEGDARRVTVIYELAERPPRAVNFGAGYNDDFGVYGTVNYRDQNVGGIGQQFSTNLLLGPRVFQFDSNFNSPYRLTEPDTLGYGANVFRRRELSRVFDDDIKLPNGDRVREGRFGGKATLTGGLAEDWLGTLGLNYSRVSIRDRDGTLSPVDARGNQLSFSGTGIDDLLTVSFAATRDQRDNPRDPTRGSVVTLSTEQSIPVGLGSILSNRVQANYAQYYPVDFLNSLEDKKQQEVLAFNLQAGAVVGDLPPYNAFVLGGANSVRGYGFGDVGSARTYVLGSAEYRFPIYKIVGGVLFADFASDLGSDSSVPGDPAGQRGKPGGGFGIGAGIRLRSPIGIIRADFGVNDQGDSRLQFGFGQRF